MISKINITLSEPEAMYVCDAINLLGCILLEGGNVEILKESLGNIQKAVNLQLYTREDILKVMELVDKIGRWGISLHSERE